MCPKIAINEVRLEPTRERPGWGRRSSQNTPWKTHPRKAHPGALGIEAGGVGR